jgi:TRAP-type C4-dicarboxylate transport system permease small subunit
MRKWLDKWLEYILACLLIVMTMDVLWGIFTRYVLGAQSSFTEELARFLLIWISILGAAYASGKKIHLSIDLLPDSLSPDSQLKLNRVISLLIMLFVLAALVIGGLRYVYITFALGQISPALQIPMGYVYLVIPFSGICILIYKIIDWKSAGDGSS